MKENYKIISIICVNKKIAFLGLQLTRFIFKICKQYFLANCEVNEGAEK